MRRTIVMATALAALVAASPARAGNPAPSASEREFVGLLNQERQEQGLKPVEISPALTEIADDYAAFYDARGVEIDHAYDPPYTRRTFAAGCSGWEGPVLARGPSAQFVLDGWLSSSGHRAVLLDPTITHVGPGTKGEYWMSYGMTCERNALNTSGDFGTEVTALPADPVEVGALKGRGRTIRTFVNATAGSPKVRLLAKQRRRTVRGAGKILQPGAAPVKLTVKVPRRGRWRVALLVDGEVYKTGTVRLR